jgi:hypothetical protein
MHPFDVVGIFHSRRDMPGEVDRSVSTGRRTGAIGKVSNARATNRNFNSSYRRFGETSKSGLDLPTIWTEQYEGVQ